MRLPAIRWAKEQRDELDPTNRPRMMKKYPRVVQKQMTDIAFTQNQLASYLSFTLR